MPANRRVGRVGAAEQTTPAMLHYEIHGESGPFILLVHGMLSSRAQWLPNLPALSQGFRPVVAELLGHGRSPAPEDLAAYAPSAYVGYFEQIREAVDADRWYMVGQSLGAALTLGYALEFPDRVIAQAFTNSVAAFAPPGWAEVVRPLAEKQLAEFQAKGRAALEHHRLNPTRSRHLPLDVRKAFREDMELADLRGVAFTGLYTSLAVSVHGRVEKNRVPTLMVVGRREARFEEARRYAERAIPNLSVRSLNAGHAVNIGAAEEFNDAVLEFFEAHPAEGSSDRPGV